MKQKTKVVLSLILVVVLAISLCGINAGAVDSRLSFTNATVLIDGSADQTVTLDFKTSEAFELARIVTGVSYNEGATEESFDYAGKYIILTSLSTTALTITTNDDCSVYEPDPPTYGGEGAVNWNGGATPVTIAAGGTIFSATYTVSKDTPAGTYTVYAYGCEIDEGQGAAFHTLETATYSATITVEHPSAAPAWELYYTLDQTTDTDGDNYNEYDPRDTVVATIYMKAQSADVLQAFDFTVVNDSKLEYKSYTSTYGTRVASGTGASTATSQHIQAIGADKDHPINQTMPAGEGVVLATITYQVKDTAVYNTGMPITIQSSANFAVERNPASFTPSIQSNSSTTLGVETLAQWTVTFYDDTTAMTDPAPQTVNQGATATNPGTPTKDGYSFDGWYQESACTNAFNFSTPITADTNIYAKFTQIDYHVNWHWGYDTANNQYDSTKVFSDPAVYHYGDPATYTGDDTPVKPSSNTQNFTFLGWNTDPSATTALDSLTVTGNTEFYAIFEASTRTYTVTWLDQDGTALSTSEIEYNQTPAYQGGFTAPTKPEDNGYTYSFAGWATSANQESGTELADLPAVTGEITYYAAYAPTAKEFNISYETNGGTINAGQVDTYTYGIGATLPTNVTKTGYTFGGWYDNSGLSGDAITTITDTQYGNVTVYAKWTENKYNVKYVAGEGTGLDYTDSDILYTANYTIKSWSEVSFTAPTGYVFAGWSASNSQTYTTGQQYTGMSATDGDTIVLTATWAQDVYNITYAFTDGTNSLTSVTNGNAETYSKAAGLVLTDPSKDGYTFTGWTAVYTGTETAVTLTDGNTIPSGTEGDITLTANFTIISYTITYNANGGTVDPATQQYTVTSTDALAIPTRDGYDFAGWKNEGAAVGTWDANETTSASGQNLSGDWGDVTLTAQWTVKTYTITFTGMTGANTTATYTTEDTATIASKQSNPTKDYYTFAGWLPSGADNNWGTSVLASDTVLAGKYGDVTLTAQWTAIEYTITFYQDPEKTTVLTEETFSADDATITVPDVPAKDGYTGEWSSYTTNPADGNQVVYPIYTAVNYTITYNANNGNVSPATQTYTIESTTALAVPTRDGYTFKGWKNEGAAVGSWAANETTDENGQNLSSDWGNVTLTAQWTPTTYTIKFNTDGGTAIPNMTYTIESTDTLPTASGKPNFAFTGWKVTTAGGNWVLDAEWNGGTSPVTGQWGDVTLTAQWDQNITYVVEEYKYAPTGYKLLIIDAAGAGEGKVYTYDGATMYYTENANYQIGSSTGVFYTLIEVDDLTLTDAQVGKIAASAGTPATITYSGDINGDGKINIADANAIYQMVVATGSYYSLDQLTIAQRLAADTVKATANAEHRGSVEDVNAVVQLINGEIESLSNLSNGTIDPQGSVYWLGRKYILAIPTPAETQKFSLCI